MIIILILAILLIFISNFIYSNNIFKTFISSCKITTSKKDGNGVLNGNLSRVDANEATVDIYEYKSSQEIEQDAKTIRGDGLYDRK